MGLDFILFHFNVYMSIPIAQFVTPPSPPPHSFPPLVSICLFSTSVCQLLPCKPAHLYHFSRWRYPFYIRTILFNYNQDFQDIMIFQNKISPKVYNIPYYKSIKNIQHSFLFLRKTEKKCFQRKEILHSNGLIWEVSSYEYEKIKPLWILAPKLSDRF